MRALKRHFSFNHTVGTTGCIIIPVCVVRMAGIDISAFVLLPPLLLVGGLTFCLSLFCFGKTFLEFIPDAIKTLFTSPVEPNLKYAEIAQCGSRYARGAGFIGAIIGGIYMISHLEDVYPGIATILLSLLYALILSELFFALLYKVYLNQREERVTRKALIKTDDE